MIEPLSWTRRTVLALGAALLGGCAVAQPFHGPGYDRARGVTICPESATVLVVVTHAVIDPDRRGRFDEQTALVRESLEGGEHPGLVGYSTRKLLLGDEVWTLTVWKDAASLAGFLRSSVHRHAIAVSAEAIRQLDTARAELPARAIPLGWDRALELLDQRAARPEGRSP